jgi:hypothetical protein
MHLVTETSSGNSDEQLHRLLAAYNRQRLAPCVDTDDWRARLARAHRFAVYECEWIERERAAVAPLLADVPTDADAFVAWFQSLAVRGPGQGDPLFPWLARTASREHMRWFLRQELAGEAGFDDLVALSQVKMPETAKLELARNYWDEMGRGRANAMHGPMLDGLADELELDALAKRVPVVWESLALANAMVAFASHRHYAYQSLGALGAIELTAPARCEDVVAGLERLGVDGRARRYYALHASLDVKHSEAWNREVLRPLVNGDPSLAVPLAEGALIRLRAGARCFERYRAELGLRLRVVD